MLGRSPAILLSRAIDALLPEQETSTRRCTVEPLLQDELAPRAAAVLKRAIALLTFSVKMNDPRMSLAEERVQLAVFHPNQAVLLRRVLFALELLEESVHDARLKSKAPAFRASLALLMRAPQLLGGAREIGVHVFGDRQVRRGADDL